MFAKTSVRLFSMITLFGAVGWAQPVTILPHQTLEGLGGVVSGSRPLNVLKDIAGYNRDRQAAEFSGTWHESEVLAARAREYGYQDVEILKYPRNPIWDGIRGELWVISPVLRKIVDFKDIPTALAPGSVTGTYEGEMVWLEEVNEATLEGVDVQDKVVVTASSTRGAFRAATGAGAAGVVNMNTPRPSVTPNAILWSSIGQPEKGFAFNISAPMLEGIKRLGVSGPIRFRAEIEAEWRDVDNEVITAVIPGDGSTDEWVYLSAHVFEGINKQGAADDGSGAVLILEAGRTILEAIQRGFVKRPARNLRFMWVDEFSGTFAFLNSHPEEFKKATADINIDMAGQNVTLNNNATRLYRMPDSRIHFVADVAQEFFEWVGITNIERVHERRGGYGFSFPLLDPYGTRDAWRYVIDPFYGSSDHQVYNDRGVPAVLFNHWPDMVCHTSHDRPELMDATQMKRTAFITAATALATAGTPDIDPIQVASMATARGRSRVAENVRQWTHFMANIEKDELAVFYRDLNAACEQWYKRELRNLESVLELTRGSTTGTPGVAQAAISELASRLRADMITERRALWSYYNSVAASRGVEPVNPALNAAEREAQRLIPVMSGELPRRVRARELPGFASMEVRNFIDGKRSALEIRNAVNSEYRLEYGPIALDAVIAHLRQLEEAGAVQFPGSRSTRRQ